MKGATTKPIVIERELPYQPEKVWRALTRRPLMDYWLMMNDFEPVVGHRFKLWSEIPLAWNDPIDCEVLDVTPCRRLSYRWDCGGARTTVVWSLSPTKNGVRLRMEQTATSDYRAECVVPSKSFFDEFVGKTCRGLYMQTVPISAEWFRKRDGVPWVKFVFGRRVPVDLPVSLNADTLWFTDPRGTAYELSPAGPNRLTGRSRTQDGPLDLSCN